MMKDQSENIISKSKLEDYPMCTLNEKIEQNLKDFLSFSEKCDLRSVETEPEEIASLYLITTPKVEKYVNDGTVNSIRNFKMRCRTCLTTEKNRIYTKVTHICKDSITIKTALLWVTPKLKVKLDKDDRICDDCLEILKSIVTFVCKCLKSDATLWSELRNVAQKGTSERKEDTMENGTVEGDTIEEHLVENESSYPIENHSELENQDQSDICTKEIEYWDQCRKDYCLTYRDTNQILASYRFSKVTNNDFDLEDHEKLISVAPLHYSFPALVNSIKSDFAEKVQVVNYSNPWQENDRRRVILLGSKLYQNCPICHDKFPSESLLEAHFDSEHKDVSKAYLIRSYQKVVSRDHLKCDVCDKNYQLFSKLKEHSEVCLLLKCPYCKVLVPISDISNHIRVEHLASFSLKCYKCKKTFFRYDSFQAHNCVRANRLVRRKSRMCLFCKQLVPVKEYNIHVKSTHMLHVCTICDQHFATGKLLRDHDLHHKTELCSICGIFLSKRNYYKHVRVMHSKVQNEESPLSSDQNTFRARRSLRKPMKFINKRTYICDICGIVCSEQHLRSHHRSLDCLTCKKSFQTIRNLKLHMNRNHRKPYVICEMCGLKCQADYLKMHMSTVHSENKNFVCQICDKGFSRKDYLNRHVMIHRTKTQYSRKQTAVVAKKNVLAGHPKYIKYPNEPYSCKFCFKTFKYLHQLRIHIDSHIKLVRHKCRYCDTTYSNLGNRQKHEKLHEEKNYKFRCNSCWKKFSNKEELDAHESSNHNKNFQCEYCDKSFSRKFVYMSHLVEMHFEMEMILKAKENIILESIGECSIDESSKDES